MPGEIRLANGHPRDFVEEQNRASGRRKKAGEQFKCLGPRIEGDFGGVGLGSETFGECLELVTAAEPIFVVSFWHLNSKLTFRCLEFARFF